MCVVSENIFRKHDNTGLNFMKSSRTQEDQAQDAGEPAVNWIPRQMAAKRTTIGILMAALTIGAGSAQTTNLVASVDVGNTVSEQASQIQLNGFGRPETLGGKLCRNADSTGSGDGKGGWAVFTFPSATVQGKDKTYAVEISVWGKSSPVRLRLRDTRMQKKDGNPLWVTLSKATGTLSKKEEWNTLVFEVTPGQLDDTSPTQSIGIGGGDSQIWFSKIAIRTLSGKGAAGFSILKGQRVMPGTYPVGTLIDKGKALATIVIPADADAGLQYAAADMQEVFHEMTGVVLPVADDAQTVYGNRILLGDARCSGELITPAERAALGKEEFIIRQRGRDLVITGGGSYGVIYGCAELYEQLGARWYMPGELGACVPKLETIRFENLNIRRTPSFAMRWVGKDLKWNLRNRSNFVSDQQMPPAFIVHPSIYHSQQYWLPDQEYFAGHSDFFALIDGKRSRDEKTRKLCNSNPGVAKEIVKNMARDFREKPYINLLSLSPTDGRAKCWCECDACRALDQPDYALIGEPIPSDCLYSRRQMVLYNKVASELEKEFPDQRILVGAYANYTWPPKDPALKAHHNLAVIICRYENYCYAHPVKDEQCEPNRRFLALIRAWKEQTPHIYFYEYYLKTAWLNFPWPIVHSISADIPFYKQMGVEGLYTQYSTDTIWTDFMPMYIAARLLWDHTADTAAILSEFYTKFYGEAALPMKAYHECLENAMANSPHDHIGYARKTAYLLFTEQLAGEMKKHLQDAQALAATDIVRRRLDRIAVMTEYTERLARYYRLTAEAGGMDEGDAKTQILLKAYETGESLRVDVRNNPKKYEGVVNPGWLVNDISEGRTIRNLRKTLIKAGVIQTAEEDDRPEGKRKADVPEAE